MQPNVLLIVLDSVRKDHLSCYGHSRETTPTIDELATESAQYNSAIAPGPSTPPSHASMFTGLYPSHHGVFSRHPYLDESIPVLAEQLADAGYHTLGFSNSFHTSQDRGFSRGFEYYHDILNMNTYSNHIFELSIDYLNFFTRYFLKDDDISYFQENKLKTKVSQYGEPFFGFINFNSAHIPYRPPERFETEFLEKFDQWDEVDEKFARELADDAGDAYIMDNADPTDADWEFSKHLYDAEIKYMDTLLSDLFQYLKQKGMFEETMIIVTSDHGEHFGEHGLAYHKFALSEELINVPLVVKYPNSDTTDVSDELVSLVDLAPTIADVAGIELQSKVDGRSLLSDDEPEAVFAETGRPNTSQRTRMLQHGSEETFDQFDKGLQAIRTRDHKLICDSKGGSTLYDISNEEVEIVDADLTSYLQQRLGETLEELPSGETEEELSDRVEQHLRDMGYME